MHGAMPQHVIRELKNLIIQLSSFRGVDLTTVQAMPAPTTNASTCTTTEEFQRRRMEARRAKNREAAAESRRRVKQRIEALERRLERSEEENAQLRALLTSLLQRPMQTFGASSCQAVGSNGFANGHANVPPGHDNQLAHPFEDQVQIPNEWSLLPVDFADLLDEDLLRLDALIVQ